MAVGCDFPFHHNIYVVGWMRVACCVNVYRAFTRDWIVFFSGCYTVNEVSLISDGRFVPAGRLSLGQEFYEILLLNSAVPLGRTANSNTQHGAKAVSRFDPLTVYPPKF
jgi:hypothetical protein